MKIAPFFKDLYHLLYRKSLKYKQGVGWTVAAVVVFIVLILYQFDALSRLELLSLDMRFQLRHVKPQASEIVFIDMAEDSVSAIGRWPWPRKWHATLIKILSEYKPKAIAFDVIFSEPQDETDDLVLQEAMRQSGVVYMPLVYDMDTERMKDLYKAVGVKGVHGPIPRFLDVAKGTGHINAVPDPDGILRRVPPIITFEGRSTYQFGMKIGLDMLGLENRDITFDPKKHLLYLKRPDGKVAKVALDKDNQLVVNWLGPWGREFEHYSFIDVVKSYALI